MKDIIAGVIIGTVCFFCGVVTDRWLWKQEVVRTEYKVVPVPAYSDEAKMVFTIHKCRDRK